MMFAYGFRVFFLAAALLATTTAGLWAASLWGVAGGAALSVNTHAHEMLFGFGGAVVAGFVLTAVPNWTKSERVHGAPLLVLSLFWLAGRAAPFVTGPIAFVLHAAGALFLFGVALAIGVPIVRARALRNYGVLALVIALASLAAASHAAFTGALAVPTTTLARDGAWALGLLIAVIGGRVTPAFTRNALQRAGIAVRLRERDRRDDVAVVTAPLAVLAMVLDMPAAFVGTLFLLAAITNAARMLGWGSRAAARDPLLAVLHAGYAWLVIAFALTGVSFFLPTVVTAPTALHALTVGTIGTYTIGMMARVALGHTGRPLRAPAPATLAFVVINVAALVRLAAPSIDARLLPIASAILSAAFALYLLVYLPVLLRPRPDGAPG